MVKVLVSSCLLGEPVRYNGSALSLTKSDRIWLKNNCDIVSFCPEISAGLPTPRSSAEIHSGDGLSVLNRASMVIEKEGREVTDEFVSGAHLALKICQEKEIYYAILTEYSPSCGSSGIYDGSFEGRKKMGQGVTTALLVQHGIKVINQFDITRFKQWVG